MDKTIRFENGSKIEILPAKEPKRSKRSEEQMKQIITRYRKSPYEFAKYTMGYIWNNLHWYQKVYISLLIKSQMGKDINPYMFAGSKFCPQCGAVMKQKEEDE